MNNEVITLFPLQPAHVAERGERVHVLAGKLGRIEARLAPAIAKLEHVLKSDQIVGLKRWHLEDALKVLKAALKDTET